ncbi:uncharacterized protein A4U43_C04F4780 [Asparagus officinalis]|uniref:Uncharacterized protein n=1 Tax=Asparagus officinalis TaxID=4686 RepID=A0A5P1EYE0_ASPOF|nr:uncharacterized protein LOC109836630 [Asparagus officinalis]XP_020260190.1 uncharacterized protein LOC109836630 [Asparagus officinalis]ONK71106.1 uncharacterized protein A4U43_C04F4780 [Asparagus officinalis]
MARLLFARRILSPISTYPSTISKHCSSFSDPLKPVERENERCTPTVCRNSTSNPHRINLPTLIPSSSNYLQGFSIELVDPDIWPQTLEEPKSFNANEVFDEMPTSNLEAQDFSDFDEIEDMRLRKKLFYKLDRDSKEFEEYTINFHRKKTLKKNREKTTKDEVKKECKEINKPKKDKASHPLENLKPDKEKRVRTMTFNQLTGPYHLPFCLDIFITKGSVRASIIHRVTSKVVAVAHSISKDLKFDLGSRKDAKACATVGGILAQRAIEDDIHNVVYTPRKGDKIEGKLEIVLQAIIDSGIDVKVKLKQKRNLKRLEKENGCKTLLKHQVTMSM